MRFATTIFLLIAAIALGLFVFIDQVKPFKFGEEDPVFPVLPVKEVMAFTLTNRTGNVSVKKDEDGQWKVTEPFQDRADPELVANLLNGLGALQVSQYLSTVRMASDGTSLESYGLGTDAASTVTCTLTSGQNVAYHVGAAGAVPETAYVRAGDSELHPGVFVVACGALKALTETVPDGFLDHRLSNVDPTTIDHITITQGDAAIEFKRKAGERWVLEKPLEARADNERVEAFVNLFAGAMILAVATPAEAEQNSTDTIGTATRVTFSTAESSKSFDFTLLPGAIDTKEIFVKMDSRPQLYKAEHLLLEEAKTPAVGWRDSKLFRLVPADLESVTFASKDGNSLTLTQLGSTWFTKFPGDAQETPVNQSQMERFLKDLDETGIQRYASETPADHDSFGLVDPAFTITFAGRQLAAVEGRETVRLELGQVPQTNTDPGNGNPLSSVNDVYARLDGEPFVYAISPAFLDQVRSLADPLPWKSLEVMNIAYPTFREVRCAPANGAPLTLKIDFAAEPDKRMLLSQGEEDITSQLEPKAAGELILKLGTLTAERWLENTLPALTNLARPSLVLTVKAAAPTEGQIPGAEAARAEEAPPVEERVKTLRFAPLDGSGSNAYYYGQMEGQKEVFLIDAATYRLLTGEPMVLR